MKLFGTRKFYRPGIIDHKIEFLAILSWMLFFPVKNSYFYFLGTALLIGLISVRNVYFNKTFAISSFNLTLGIVSLGLIISLFFSIDALKSLKLTADLVLIFIYFTLFYKEQRKETDQFLVISYIISVFSALTVAGYLFPTSLWGSGGRAVFFASSIHEGIISGMGVLILLYYVLAAEKTESRRHWKFYLLLTLNIAGVFVSQSKAAYLGTVGFALVLLLMRRKKWLPFLAIFIALTFVIPNPIRSMVVRSLTKDPYAANRIDIWKMCAGIFIDYPITGVGLDNFEQVSKGYNFKQPRGPSNYGKVPRNTHNDYFKLICETGIGGLALLLLMAWFLARKLFVSPLNITSVLILYLLFQAFLFNILFTTFFLFIFLYLLKTLLESAVTFRSFSSPLKFSFIILLVLMTLSAYLLPWWSDALLKKRHPGMNYIQRFELLNSAAALNPLDAGIYLLKAAALRRYFQRTTNWESFYDALALLKKARRLRGALVESYTMEAGLYFDLISKGLMYEHMDEEIITILEQAETHDPYNPFIKMTKAHIYRQFEQPEKARQQALAAIALEPDYVEALIFLDRNFNHFPDENAFQNRLEAIAEKAKSWAPLPGHYLYRLWKMPGKKEVKKAGS